MEFGAKSRGGQGRSPDFLKLPIDRDIHRDEAGKTAESVGDGFREINARRAEADGGEKKRQRNDDQSLTEQGEKDRLLCLAERLERGLSRELKRHENEAEEIDIQHFCADRDRFGFA